MLPIDVYIRPGIVDVHFATKQRVQKSQPEIASGQRVLQIVKKIKEIIYPFCGLIAVLYQTSCSESFPFDFHLNSSD